MGEQPHVVPEEVTPKVFDEWRSPRYGSANPERMNNPLWEWLIDSTLDAYRANRLFNGPSAFTAGPMWCFSRFGQSATTLPDGRTVLIAGEHEDSYDPDFYIYNDVVVVKDGHKEIFGYPREVFPPTDFHSATLTDSQIVLIGSLGYQEGRRIGQTQVLVVERESWKLSRVDATGECPGWIHGHNAQLRPDGASVLLTGGKLIWDVDRHDVENVDEWQLNLCDWRWERLTDRRWPRFEVYRQDRKRNHLWESRTALFAQNCGLPDRVLDALKLDVGESSRLDLVRSLYTPPVSHEVLAAGENEYGVYRIRVGGVVVKYVEQSFTLQVTVEGELAPQVVEHLQEDLTRKLESIEQAPIVCQEIPVL